MQQMSWGTGGWVRVHEPSVFSGWLYFRLDPDAGAVTDVHLDGGGREITPAGLRSIPLARYRSSALQRPDLFRQADVTAGASPVPNAALPFVAPDPKVAASLDDLFPFARGLGYKQPQRVRLSPPTDGLTDDFLRQVAAAYQSAIAHDERPNKALADQTNYPRRTVERWVYLARKAGHLPRTRQGEAR